MRIAGPSAFLLDAPNGARQREALHGQAAEVLERRGSWARVRLARDGYEGWVSRTLEDLPEPTHAVRARVTHLYPAPDLKRPPLTALSFGSELAAELEGRWARTEWEGAPAWVHAAHLRPIGEPMRDPVAVAALFLGTPYVWAGNAGWGLDCSGLVQAACLACGIPCMGDSIDQSRTLGEPFEDAPRCGDLIFWRGHVAWVSGADEILHANGYAMQTCAEGLSAAIARIEGQGGGAPTARRRITPPRG